MPPGRWLPGLPGTLLRLPLKMPRQYDMYLATMLEAAAYQKGLSKPLDEKDPAVEAAKQLGPKAVEEAMAYAMLSGHPAAAAAAAEILGQIGKAEELLYEGPKPAPLALALRSPDRRLRIVGGTCDSRPKTATALCGLELPYPGFGIFRIFVGDAPRIVGRRECRRSAQDGSGAIGRGLANRDRHKRPRGDAHGGIIAGL